jgi:hypothetical protein
MDWLTSKFLAAESGTSIFGTGRNFFVANGNQSALPYRQA